MAQEVVKIRAALLVRRKDIVGLNQPEAFAL